MCYRFFVVLNDEIVLWDEVGFLVMIDVMMCCFSLGCVGYECLVYVSEFDFMYGGLNYVVIL